jgi:murein DD-endopeptidase MepM/ murein hydrolase activator NlpD
MRTLWRGSCVALTIAVACVVLPAGALAGTPAHTAGTGVGGSGGTGPGGAGAETPQLGAPQAPSAPRAGGAQYGALTGAAAGTAPVVSVFEVPSSVVAGKPPLVRLRIDSPHAGTVHVKVILLRAATREPLISIDVGWVHTARPFTVRWSRRTRLLPGEYELAVGVHGHRTGPAHAFAHTSRSAPLTVTAPPTPAPGTTEALPPGVPTPAQSAALGAAFPVAGAHDFGGAENRFGAPRSGHVHEGQDVLTAEGTPIVAPLAGTIIATGYQAGGAGYYAAEHTAVGLDFFFAHCEAASLLVKEGEAVAAAQALCAAGRTGDATAPHLHFEIWVGGWHAAGGYAIDPLPYLEAWERARA